MATVGNTPRLLEQNGLSLAYVGSSILIDPQSDRWVVVLTAYVVEVAVYTHSEAWDLWKLRWLPPAILGSFRKLELRSCSREKGLLILIRFLAVLDGVDRT